MALLDDPPKALVFFEASVFRNLPVADIVSRAATIRARIARTRTGIRTRSVCCTRAWVRTASISRSTALVNRFLLAAACCFPLAAAAFACLVDAEAPRVVPPYLFAVALFE